jgi:hypothetical protein
MTVSLALMIILTVTLPFHTRAQTGFLNGFVDLFQDLFSFDDGETCCILRALTMGCHA